MHSVEIVALSILVLAVTAGTGSPSSGSSMFNDNEFNREDNEIAIYPDESENEIQVREYEPVQSLPACLENSVCGYLQVNSRGISRENWCTCKHSTCPMEWDERDGHSVTQGSDQYKYCGTAPELKSCKLGDVAYTNAQRYLGEELIAKYDKMYCECSGHNKLGEPQVDFQMEGEILILNSIYKCVELPLCGDGDICKAITETSTSLIVKVECQCPYPQSCPSSTNKLAKVEKVGKGLYKQVQCQSSVMKRTYPWLNKN